jgi:hypothetical protein
MNQNNVIHVDAATWYCMRQCRESINYLTTKRDPRYAIEINGEKELYRHFMDSIVKVAA